MWSSILRALDTQPTGLTEIQGASGLVHPVVAAGADDDEKRLVVISAESTARNAAMAQADIQTATPDVQVVVARPVAINLADVVDGVRDAFGTETLGKEQFQTLSDKDEKQTQAFLEPILEPAMMQFMWGAGAMGVGATFQQLIAQARQLKAVSAEGKNPDTGADQTEWTLDFSGLADLDPAQEDLALGICPIPLYSFSEHELGLIGDAGSATVVQQLLREHDVLQYFFPSPDQVALGLVERVPGRDVVKTIETAPTIGHPLGEMELVASDTPVVDIIDALKERNLVVEGELTQELTQDGTMTRATVKFLPKEGVVSKLINRVSVNVDLSTRFFGGA